MTREERHHDCQQHCEEPLLGFVTCSGARVGQRQDSRVAWAARRRQSERARPLGPQRGRKEWDVFQGGDDLEVEKNDEEYRYDTVQDKKGHAVDLCVQEVRLLVGWKHLDTLVQLSHVWETDDFERAKRRQRAQECDQPDDGNDQASLGRGRTELERIDGRAKTVACDRDHRVRRDDVEHENARTDQAAHDFAKNPAAFGLHHQEVRQAQNGSNFRHGQVRDECVGERPHSSITEGDVADHTVADDGEDEDQTVDDEADVPAKLWFADKSGFFSLVHWAACCEVCLRWG